MECSFGLPAGSNVYMGPAADLLPGLLSGKRVVAVTDEEVARCCASLVAPYETLLVGRGEVSKTLRTVEELYRAFLGRGVDRRTFILGVGGGIVTDVAGFAASTFMRGLRFGFVPTTLLGQVDASVGGKNGVNVDGYKNMAGCFAQPEFVVCDPALLGTLPDREFRAGLAEVVKAAIIADRELFVRLEALSFGTLRHDSGLLHDAIGAAIRVKAGIVGRDERETGERRKLNLGHTLAHAIEKCSGKMNHGEAVAVGTALVAGAAVRLGTLAEEERLRIVRLLEGLGFDLKPPVPLSELLRVVLRDKKSADGLLHVVLPVGIGCCDVRPMTLETFAAALGI